MKELRKSEYSVISNFSRKNKLIIVIFSHPYRSQTKKETENFIFGYGQSSFIFGFVYGYGRRL